MSFLLFFSFATLLWLLTYHGIEFSFSDLELSSNGGTTVSSSDYKNRIAMALLIIDCNNFHMGRATY